MEGGNDGVTCELSLTRDPAPEKAAAADHKEIHGGMLTRWTAYLAGTQRRVNEVSL